VHDSANITAAILAGGLGTRLRSVVADKPKVLAEILGRPFLTYLLDQLVRSEVERVVLCTGYLGESVHRQIGNSYGPLTIEYSQERSSLGTGGALRLALPFLTSDTVLVLNGDSYCQADLRLVKQWHSLRKSDATLLLVNSHDTKRYGRVSVGAAGHVVTFDEKAESEGPGLINAGIYLIKRALIETIPEGKPVSLEQEMFPAWIGHGLYGYETTGLFLDIGTPEAYSESERFFTEIGL
jgi:D-glycero-alpha-D-manno-heptose 1-phosphate guanylyltransferase